MYKIKNKPERVAEESNICDNFSDLHRAVYFNDEDLLTKKLQSSEINLNAIDGHGRTALGLAVEKGFADLVVLLLRCEAIINKGLDYNKPLFIAVRKTTMANTPYETYDCCLHALLQHGANVNEQVTFGMSPLHHMFLHILSSVLPENAHIHLSTLQAFINYGADVNLINTAGKTILGILLLDYQDYLPKLNSNERQNWRKAVELLLKRGADLELISTNKQQLFQFSQKINDHALYNLLSNCQDPEWLKKERFVFSEQLLQLRALKQEYSAIDVGANSHEPRQKILQAAQNIRASLKQHGYAKALLDKLEKEWQTYSTHASIINQHVNFNCSLTPSPLMSHNAQILKTQMPHLAIAVQKSSSILLINNKQELKLLVKNIGALLRLIACERNLNKNINEIITAAIQEVLKNNKRNLMDIKVLEVINCNLASYRIALQENPFFCRIFPRLSLLTIRRCKLVQSQYHNLLDFVCESASIEKLEFDTNTVINYASYSQQHFLRSFTLGNLSQERKMAKEKNILLQSVFKERDLYLDSGGVRTPLVGRKNS